jgi:hypothetical protein
MSAISKNAAKGQSSPRDPVMQATDAACGPIENLRTNPGGVYRDIQKCREIWTMWLDQLPSALTTTKSTWDKTPPATE